MADELQQRLKFGDMDNPANAYEAEMFAAVDHAERHLCTGYNQAMECGLNTTAAKSTGVMLAITRLLGAHIIQHCGNMLLPKDKALYEINTVVKNLECLIEDNYDEALKTVLTEVAAKETKQ